MLAHEGSQAVVLRGHLLSLGRCELGGSARQTAGRGVVTAQTLAKDSEFAPGLGALFGECVRSVDWMQAFSQTPL